MRNDPIDLQQLDARVEAKRPVYTALADKIWDLAELRFNEHQSAKAQIEQLEAEGFTVTAGIAGIPTAFIAESKVGPAEGGAKGPVIGFLGEFDALSGLSQQAGVAEPMPITAGGIGHGCGHNLLGTGAMLAAVAARDALKESGASATIRYFGCPAEEGGSGKTFMAREGVFHELDVAITWHAHAFNGAQHVASLANIQCYFRFVGKPSHAAGSPHLGRSALDAAELMNIGVNFLREHMPSDCRVHYAFTDAGGTSPNVVQGTAELLYLVRAPKVSQALQLFERVVAIAGGAAQMTETKMSYEVDKACSEIVPNNVLERTLAGCMERIGAPSMPESGRAFAEQIRKTFTEEDIASSVANAAAPEEMAEALVHEGVLPFNPSPVFIGGSTDVGDVSWIVPTVQAWGACYTIGTPFHTWQMVAQGKEELAHNGMMLAAKAMAATALEVARDPELLAAAKAEHKRRTGGKPYACPIPEGVVPPPLRGKKA
ncbi:amidohydrolase [Acetobacteraceae bacterium H6797]|nr:amidohydrolase [Acetobacteraceae bacterium H6797]